MTPTHITVAMTLGALFVFVLGVFVGWVWGRRVLKTQLATAAAVKALKTAKPRNRYPTTRKGKNPR